MRSALKERLMADAGAGQKLLDHLETMLTENRKEKFAEIVRNRTRHITIVLEDIFQPHNASAVLRTCDCFGIQDVHIIENRNKYEVNPDVALGSSKWLTIRKYNRAEDNTAECIAGLKERGYRVIATTPHLDGYTPETLPLDEKTALLFGTELEGLSATAAAMADGFIRIPMYGFTESLNISVSAAVLLHTLTERLRTNPAGRGLTSEEQLEVRLEWAMNSIRRSSVIASEFLAKQSNG